MLKNLHSPSDFKIGTVFQGKVNGKKFEILNIFHKKYTNTAGKVRYKKQLTVSYRVIGTEKIFTTDIDTLCRCNIKILEDKK